MTYLVTKDLEKKTKEKYIGDLNEKNFKSERFKKQAGKENRPKVIWKYEKETLKYWRSTEEKNENKDRTKISPVISRCFANHVYVFKKF